MAIAFGVAAGFVGVLMVELVSARVYPMPDDLRIDDRQAMVEFVSQLPVGALGFLVAAHLVGAILAGAACEAFLREDWWPGPLILGSLFTMAGVANLIAIPHPFWFAVIDCLCYLPGSFLGFAAAHYGMLAAGSRETAVVDNVE